MAINSEIVSICLQRGTVPGCWTDPATDEKSSVLIAAAFDHNGEPIPAGTISPQDPAVDIGLVYLGTDGDALDPQPDPADVEAGPCCACGAPECIESREWTFGIDNTGTRFSWDVDITVTLSDGSDFTFQQTPTAGWSQQITLWAAEMQAAMPWTVSEPRCDLPAGCGGLPGTPTGVVLPNMFWRYANVQVCPGDPIPVKAEISAINGGGAPASKLGFVLASDGPIEGPLLTFRRCQNCGEEAVWYEEDGVTPVAEGLEPRCSWPCGLPPAPVPDALCQFDSQEGCDTTGSADPNDWISVVRVITICQGEEPQTNYYVEDTSDPEGGLLEYTIIDDFLVDCETGDPIPEPVICDDPLPGNCVKARTLKVGYDNGRSGHIGPRTLALGNTYEIQSWTVNGDEQVTAPITLGPWTAGQWTQQMNDLGDELALLDPNLLSESWAMEVYPAPFWRVTAATVCDPNAVYGSLILEATAGPNAGTTFTLTPILLEDETDYLTAVLERNCDSGTATQTVYDKTGAVVELNPDCCYPCDFEFPEVDYPPLCEQVISRLCDGGAALTEYVQVTTTCPGEEPLIETFTVASWDTATSPDDLVDYVVVGSAELCDPNAETECILAGDGIEYQVVVQDCPTVGKRTAEKSAKKVKESAATAPCKVFLGDNGSVLTEPPPGPYSLCCKDDREPVYLCQPELLATCSEGGEPTCAWGAGNVDANAEFEAEEGGIVWTICDVDYQMPPGTYPLAAIQGWINANTPHTVTIIPQDEKNVVLYFSVPCDCSGVSFTIGDDDPVPLAPIPEYDMPGGAEETSALRVTFCDDPTTTCADGETALRVAQCEECENRVVTAVVCVDADQSGIATADGGTVDLLAGDQIIQTRLEDCLGVPLVIRGYLADDLSVELEDPSAVTTQPCDPEPQLVGPRCTKDANGVRYEVYSLLQADGSLTSVFYVEETGEVAEPTGPFTPCEADITSCVNDGETHNTLAVDLPCLTDYECGAGDGSSTGSFTQTISGNNTDTTFSYNATTLKWQGQNPFNDPSAQGMLDFIDDCLAAGGSVDLAITDQSGNAGAFTITGYVSNNPPVSVAYSGTGDTSLTQSGKVREAVATCSATVNDPKGALRVTFCEPSYDIVTDEVCVDGAFATRYRGIDPATGDLAGWERFEDGLGAEIPGPVTISDPCDCDCACNDSCAPEGCTDVQCGILRLDADPASLSQSTLEGYTLEFTGTGFGAGCDSVNHSFGDETLTVVDIDGTNTIANFADVINAQLAGHGFTAAYCDERPGGGTATAGQGVAVQGPTCPGITWELKLDSGGSGDDYAIGWDGFSLHSHEWVSGVALTDPNNDYSLDGGWDIRDCGDCAP